jgi:hypothetical protein
MNPFSGIITSAHKQLFNDMINALLENTALTVPCRLVFENTKLQDCPNCIYDPISRKSSNLYQTGGPIPFANGQICPYCIGNGSLSFSNDQDLYLGIIKPGFFNMASLDLESVNFVDGKIQSLCEITYYAKIKNASYIIIDTNITDLTINKYIRYRDPIPVGFGDNNFIITTWQSVQ